MVIRQFAPFSLGFEGGRKPSHPSVAVAVSIGVHVLIGLYVAMLKFTGPPPQVLPQGPVIKGPWVVELPKPPPPSKSPPRSAPPRVHETPRFTEQPVPPLSYPKVDAFPPAPGPITFDPPAPQPEPVRPRDPIIHDPTWVKRPDAGDFARFYPERAQRLNREGEAEITCGVLASGKLTGCRVTGESPQNFGFGEAALKLARYLQIAPKTVDGQPLDGGILIVPISFRLPR